MWEVQCRISRMKEQQGKLDYVHLAEPSLSCAPFSLTSEASAIHAQPDALVKVYEALSTSRKHTQLKEECTYLCMKVSGGSW